MPMGDSVRALDEEAIRVKLIEPCSGLELLSEALLLQKMNGCFNLVLVTSVSCLNICSASEIPLAV